MSASITAFAYLIASVCFIMALRGLSSPKTARMPKRFGLRSPEIRKPPLNSCGSPPSRAQAAMFSSGTSRDSHAPRSRWSTSLLANALASTPTLPVP